MIVIFLIVFVLVLIFGIPAYLISDSVKNTRAKRRFAEVDHSKVTVLTKTSGIIMTLDGGSLILERSTSKKIIPLSQIVSVEVVDPKGGLSVGTITLKLNGGADSFVQLTSFLTVSDSSIVLQIDHNNVERAHKLQNQIMDSIGAANAPAVARMSNADEIAKYKNLLDQGIISPSEFEAKKQQLLNS